jgi:6-phosphogluconolactonase
MSNIDRITWHVYQDGKALARDASERVFRIARNAIGVRGEFTIVLSGGKTPEHTFHYLARGESDWSRWQVFFADERLCEEEDDCLVNYRFAQKHFLADVAIPRTQVHKIMVDAGFDVAIDAYLKQLRKIKAFDLVLLGMGEDGHTASLFPGQKYDPQAELLALPDSPAPFRERVSMNYGRLNESRKVIVLIEGAEKRPAVAAWLAGEDLPISRITGLDGIDVLIDKSAYPSS